MNPGYFFPANLPTIPTTASVLEAQNRIAQATFTDRGFVAAGLGHPSYDEMIYAAITALKEGSGSSERAISKYIERVYSDLPLTHETILAHQLKRLKDSGQIVMVKKSYKLPGSDTPHAASNPASQPGRRGRPPKLKPIPSTQPVLVSLGLVDEAPVLSSEKKEPGLPPKSGTQPEHLNPASQPGRPPKLEPIPSTQPVLVSLGLVDEAPALSSEKKEPGLPPKSGTQPEHLNPAFQPGRPPKLEPIPSTQPVLVSLGLVDEAPALSSEKKEPGLPPKSGTQPEHSNPASQPGRRGRPPKLKPIPSTQPVLVSLGLVDEATALSSEKKEPGLPPQSGSQPEHSNPASQPGRRGRPPNLKPIPSTQPVLVSLGLVDEAPALSSEKIGPGLPPQSGTQPEHSNPASQPGRRGRPPKLKPIPSTQPVLVSLGIVDEAPALSSEKIGPGLPPQSGTQPEHSNPASQPGRRGRPPKLKPIPSTQPVLVSLGIVDEAPALSSEKIGPGLPPKSGTQPEHSNPASQLGRRGRPPKRKPIPSTQPVLVSLGLVDEAPALSSEKKGPDLPPKSGTQPEQGGTVLGKRGRGRPRGSKNMKLGPKGVKKGPGRPPKDQTHLVVNPYASDTIPLTTIGAESVPKRRGRPKKVATATAAAAGAPPSAVNEGSDTVNPGGVKKAVGRPRKNAPAAGNDGVQLQDLNTVGYGELKRKFDLFQAQVKAVVDVIKPYIRNATALSVHTAIQELDGLASMDVSVPLKDQTQTKS